MATHIQSRGDTAANWSSVNPVLADREIGLETDTLKFKFGNGVSAWSSLSYASAAQSYMGAWSYSANADADPTLTDGQWVNATSDRGAPGDSNYVQSGTLVFKVSTGFRYV